MGAGGIDLSRRKDTLFRIHGTNQPEYIRQSISSGCIRITNEDVIDLYNRSRWARSWWCWRRSRRFAGQSAGTEAAAANNGNAFDPHGD